jgi:hypothetical protein
MPLPPPTSPRKPIHTRTIVCNGYRRDDGLWDIEGHLVDTKAYTFENAWRGTMTPGTPVHEMWLRLTIDDEFLVHDVAASTDNSPFEICPAVVPKFRELVGLRIAKGWRKDVRARLGGAQGCTHLVELALGALATAAVQTIFPVRALENPELDRRAKPGHLDTCHALVSDGPVVRQHWPLHYTGPR